MADVADLTRRRLIRDLEETSSRLLAEARVRNMIGVALGALAGMLTVNSGEVSDDEAREFLGAARKIANAT